MWRAPLRLPTPSSPLLPALEPAGGGGRWAINWYSLYFCGGCWRRRRTRHKVEVTRVPVLPASPCVSWERSIFGF